MDNVVFMLWENKEKLLRKRCLQQSQFINPKGKEKGRAKKRGGEKKRERERGEQKGKSKQF